MSLMAWAVAKDHLGVTTVAARFPAAAAGHTVRLQSCVWQILLGLSGERGKGGENGLAQALVLVCLGPKSLMA